MAATSSRKSSRAKVSAHRRRLRAQGLRPIQIWVPDVRAPGFKAQAHRQSLAVATSPQANEGVGLAPTTALNEARVLAPFHALAHELRQQRRHGHVAYLLFAAY